MDKIKKNIDKIIVVLGLHTLIILCWVAFWKGACSDAKIFNEVKGTSYTCSDFWWSSSQINKLK